MRIAVFGASGGTGLQVVEQALAAGHEVTVVARASSVLPFEGADGVITVRADLFDPDAITPAIEGRDAVISALGPRGKGKADVCSRGVASIMRGMERASVKRLSVVSASGAFTGPGDGLFTRFVVKPILQRVLRESFADLRTMESEIRASGLDWTIVRPPRLLDKERTGQYRIAVGRNVPGGFTIARADVADYLLRSIDEAGTYRTVVSMGY